MRVRERRGAWFLERKGQSCTVNMCVCECTVNACGCTCVFVCLNKGDIVLGRASAGTMNL